MNTRAEDFITRTHRTPFRNESKIGVKRDGTIVAYSSKNIGDAGAQRGDRRGRRSPRVSSRCTRSRTCGSKSINVMTNSYKYSSFRCTEHPNNTLAREPILERAAYAIGMNPLEFRLKNLNLEANPDTKQPYNNSGMREVHPAGNGPGGLEREVASRRRPTKCARASSTASAWPRTRAATARAARRRRAW